MTLLKLENVYKTYHMGKVSVPVLKNINLEIKKGEYVSIMGPSGSGKSTMMNLIGALDRPSKGRILLNGTDISKLSDDRLATLRQKMVGFVFQQFNLIPRLTTLENVELPMWFAGLPKRARAKRARDLLIQVGLGDRLTHKSTELSGGQMQRVAIARALANKPEIILADEPTGNLDSKSGAEIARMLDRLNDEGKTIIIVTHDPTLAKIARRIISLKDGEIVDDRIS
ncbi:macrolide export ATP-binding/permease protein MacB [archaeon BMS3Abin16]|nr:macrolide export ATP-binding/permease protein MacB [archaeon BMS3Abin16]GBE56415.1 macrolide export ATP-binding/permease protein MacB [archaeon BMS3Bbin16]